MLFTSRPAIAGALALGAVAALAVPVAAAPTVREPDDRTRILVSISAPATVERGEDALLGVTVKDVDSGEPMAGTLVVVLRRAAGEGGWAEAERTVTDDRGRAVVAAAVKPPSTDFKAKVPRSDTHRWGRSAKVTVTVD